MTAHTPGPWKISHHLTNVDDEPFIDVDGANFYSIARIHIDTTTIVQDEANARLIAAAPEWMALATAYRNTHNQRGSDGPCDCANCREFDRLIKAMPK